MTPPFVPQIRLYQDWLRDSRGLTFDSYDALWRWSTDDLAAFWQSIWDYFELQSPTPHRAVLAEAKMPATRWFEGAQVNYARQVFRHVDAAHAAGLPAIVARNEKGQHKEITWPELRRQVASLALHLRDCGVEPGDRVAAYLPNLPETMIAFLAVASVGGVWSLCAPDMGTNAVLDRFRQIEPKVLIACDGVTYGGRDIYRAWSTCSCTATSGSLEMPWWCWRHSPISRMPSRATMRRPPPSSRCGCPSITRCGSSIRAARPACPNRSCTGTAVP
jgi:acetoacetyl-CoA synthetase